MNHRISICICVTAACFVVFPAVPMAENAPVGPEKPDTADTPSENVHLLTLKQCLEKALRNSDKLKAERARLKVFEEQQEQLWWMPFSNLALTGKFSVVPDKCADLTDGMVQPCNESGSIPSDSDFKDMTWGPTFHAAFSGAIPIPSSGKLWQGKRALDSAHAAKVAQLETFEHQIAYDVQRAYHAIIGAREMMYTLEEGRKHLQKALRKIEENLAAQTGSDTEIDAVKLKVFDAKLDAMAQQVIQIEKTALAALNFLVGSRDGRPVDLPDIPQEPVDAELKPLEKYKADAVEHRPEFEALRKGIEALEQKVKFRKSEMAPDFAFAFSFRVGYTPGVEVRGSDGTPFVFQNSYNYGSIFPGMALVGRFPLDFGVSIHKIREAKAELQAMIADKQYAMEGILLEVETAYIEAETLREAVKALGKSKRLAKGWLNAAAQNQAVGVGSSNDLKDALKEYFGIMAEYHQRISELNISVAKLDKAVGKAVSLPGSEPPDPSDDAGGTASVK